MTGATAILYVVGRLLIVRGLVSEAQMSLQTLKDALRELG